MWFNHILRDLTFLKLIGALPRWTIPLVIVNVELKDGKSYSSWRQYWSVCGNDSCGRESFLSLVMRLALVLNILSIHESKPFFSRWMAEGHSGYGAAAGSCRQLHSHFNVSSCQLAASFLVSRACLFFGACRHFVHRLPDFVNICCWKAWLFLAD